MSWRLTDRPRTAKVTKSMAKEFAEMDSIPHDRPISERRLNVYRKILADGGFRPVAWAKCHCKETGTTYRINGKHTSILLSSLSPIPEFYATIEEYEADTLEDVAKLYATFDSQSQLRTATDIYQSFAGSSPELREIPRAIVNVSAPAISFARIQDKAYILTPAERGEAMLDQVEFIVWADGMIRSAPSGMAMLKRVPVVAAMLLTWEKDARDATAFWAAVRDETGDSPDCPDRKLGRWLSMMDVSRSHGKNKKKGRDADAREFFVKCLRSWNAWRKDQKDTLRYSPDVELPKVM